MRSTSRRAKEAVPEKEPFDLKNLEAVVGETRYYFDEDKGVCFPIVIKDFVQSSCGIKATCIPLKGFGEFDVCIGDLQLKEQADQYMRNIILEQQYEDAFNELTKSHYITKKRTAFIALIETVDAAEKEAIVEEAGGKLERVSESFINKFGSKILRERLGLTWNPNGYYG